MFTGIIKTTGKVENFKAGALGARLEIAKKTLKAETGDSISVNGVCSTVAFSGKNLKFDYMPETLARSTLGGLKAGDMLNLEPSLGVSGKFHGHIVMGHVDTVGAISKITAEGNSKVFEIAVREPKRFMKLVAEKGSVAVDGVSLTVVSVSAKNFSVKLIPYTLANTIFASKKIGGAVNLEFDILAKYLEKLCK